MKYYRYIDITDSKKRGMICPRTSLTRRRPDGTRVALPCSHVIEGTRTARKIKVTGTPPRVGDVVQVVDNGIDQEGKTSEFYFRIKIESIEPFVSH